MFKHLSISVKALLAPLFSSFMIALVVAVFYSSYKTAEDKADAVATVLAHDGRVRELSAQIELTQALLGRYSSWMQTGTEIDDSLGGMAGLVANIDRINQALSAIESEFQDNGTEAIGVLRNSFDEYSKVFMKTAEVIESNPYISTNVLISSYPAYDDLLQRAIELERIVTDNLYTLEETAIALKQKALITVIGVSVFAFVASLLVGLLFGRTIVVPMKKLSHIIGRLAKGDYEVPISGPHNLDEVGVMALAVEHLKEQLQEKRQLEEASHAAKNSERIRHALGSANTNLLVTDENGDAIFVNQSMKGLLDDLADHLPKLPLSKVSESHDGLNLAMLLNDLTLADLLTSPKISQSELQLGKWSLLQIISPVYDGNDQQIGLVFEWIDLTQQKTKEAQLQEANARELVQAEQLRAGANDLLRVVDAALKGDLTQRVASQGNEAMNLIGSALDRFFTSLADNVREISINANELTDFSEDFDVLNTQMHDLAKDSFQQIGEVSSASHEISSNISSVTVAVTQMDASIREIARNSEQATVVADDAVNIAQSADKLMRQLSASSEGIGAMIKVITSIAEQTNLLALNATIEAARAGDAGKGFAVVANEVKELAKETANATDEIRRRINTIQQDSDGAVAAITEISEIIVSISCLQGQIAAGIQEQKQATQGISQSAVQTDTRAADIIENLATISAVSEHSLAGTVRSQERASRLKSMAGSMHTLVSQFTINQAPVDPLEKVA
ncbi:methyl-accepting chemotaxis protein [Granulosicoccus sp. 3-233]|uniref:methyl-accepting chemotaxis protein n=1 Tax=Granulosicoccus sp. 3-233 TaxID=3417969 RepID=UPI003D34BDCF